MTLPLLGPTIRVSVFLSIIGALQLFDMVWVMTGGGPVNASSTMAIAMFKAGFRSNQLGYGSAARGHPVPLSPRRRAAVPAVRPASRHRRRRHGIRRLRHGHIGIADDRHSGGGRCPASERLATREPARAGCLGRPGPRRRGDPVPARRTPSSAGSRRTASSRRTPARSCRPSGCSSNYTDVLFGDYAATFWRRAQQRHRRRDRGRPHRLLRRAGRRSSSPGWRSPGARPSTAVRVRSALPIGRRDPAPLHPGPQPGPVGQPARRRAAPGRVRPAADDRHPPAVLPEHPGRARGRRQDRRLQHVRLLLADPPAPRPAGAGDRQRARDRGDAGTRSSCRS